MSVQILDTKTFNYLRAGIEKAAYNSTVNEFYFYAIRQHFHNKDIEFEALRLVKSWCNMNEKSYCNKYKGKFENLAEFIYPTYTDKPLKIIQFIKYLQCLKYNIEFDEYTPQELKDYELLTVLIHQAMAAYIGNLEEYKQSNWS
jgi:hypothetical protein